MRLFNPEEVIGKNVDAIMDGERGMVIGFDDGTFIAMEVVSDSGDPCGISVDGDSNSVLDILTPDEALQGRFISKAVYNKLMVEEKAKAEERLKWDLKRARAEVERLQRLLEKNAA